MSSVFVEERLELTFDDSWCSLIKWDDERVYQQGIRKLQSTRAVDFCGVRDNGDRHPMLYLIELKDFRQYRIENKSRLFGVDPTPCKECGAIQPNLYQEVALKVRDTLAGLVAAAHQRQTEPVRWRPIAETLIRWDSHVHVVLWLDEDQPVGPAQPSNHVDNLKKQLRWLTPRVLVANSKIPPPGVTVRYLKG